MISHFHLQIVATVLKLGNLNFVPVTNMDGTEGCRIENEYELYDVGELVKVEVDSLRSALLARWSCSLLQCWDPSKLFLFNICTTHLLKQGPENSKSHKNTAPKWWKMAKTLHVAQVRGCRRREPGVRPLCERGGRCQGRPLSHHVLQVRKKILEKKKILTKMYSRWEKNIRKTKKYWHKCAPGCSHSSSPESTRPSRWFIFHGI